MAHSNLSCVILLYFHTWHVQSVQLWSDGMETSSLWGQSGTVTWVTDDDECRGSANDICVKLMDNSNIRRVTDVTSYIDITVTWWLICSGMGNGNVLKLQWDVDNVGGYSNLISIDTNINCCSNKQYIQALPVGANNLNTLWIRFDMDGSGGTCWIDDVSLSGTPTPAPTTTTTKDPTKDPTKKPTINPTPSPTNNPTPSPTNNPTPSPTDNPSKTPTKIPTNVPSTTPTNVPSKTPTLNPTLYPTTRMPSNNPSISPTKYPTKYPSINPSKQPSKSPTINPTKLPTENPSLNPSVSPSKSPSDSPTTPSPTLILPDVNDGDHGTATTTMRDNKVTESKQETTTKISPITSAGKANMKNESGTAQLLSNPYVLALMLVIVILLCLICCILIFMHKKAKKRRYKKKNKMKGVQLPEVSSVSTGEGNTNITDIVSPKYNDQGTIESSNISMMATISSMVQTSSNDNGYHGHNGLTNIIHQIPPPPDPKNTMDIITRGISYLDDDEDEDEDGMEADDGLYTMHKTAGDDNGTTKKEEGMMRSRIKLIDDETTNGKTVKDLIDDNEETEGDSDTKHDDNDSENNNNQSSDDDMYNSAQNTNNNNTNGVK